MRTLTENLYGFRKLLFPDNLRTRIGVHALFWTGFILYHLLYFVPAFKERLADAAVCWAYVIYYGRYIPLFYLLARCYPVIRERFKGVGLLLVLFAASLLLTHVTTYLLYRFYQAFIGLENLPVNFTVIGQLYLKPLAARHGTDWLVFVYDLLDLQLLAFPVGIRMMKYGITWEMEDIRRQKRKAQAELQVLRSQLSPHFVLNILNSAAAELGHFSRKGAGYLAQAANLIRFSLYETGSEFIALAKELDYIQQYVELEAMRTKQRAEITCFSSGDLRPEHCVPALMLITLVENAFKHSVHTTHERSFITIHSQVEADRLRLSIANSIPPAPGPETPGGIGLANLRRTLELKYPHDHLLDISKTQEVFSIRLELPLTRYAVQ